MDSHTTIGTGGAIAMIVAMFAIALSAELANYWENKDKDSKVSLAQKEESPETGDSDPGTTSQT